MSPDVAASIHARLLVNAKAAGEEFERTLVRYADERILYRLGASGARDRCLIKGASLLAVWLPDPYRATRDVDLLASGDSSDEALRALLDTICEVPCPEDGLRFDLLQLRIDPIRADEEYAGKRARFRAYLGKARIAVQLDFGFGDAVSPGPEEIQYPTLLKRLPAPRIRAYPREASIAEKFEAMVKLDTRNSRMKDFHDIWALATALKFEGRVLREAIRACFARRATPWTADVPRALTQPFYAMEELSARWKSYLSAGAVMVMPPAQFDVIGARIIEFLRPIRESIIADTSFALSWMPGGPWK
jgi:predicted nucleotidyltransferase component of viral defense system